MTPIQIAQQAARNIADSAFDYRSVNVASQNFVPDTPFRAVFVGVGGNVALESIAGNQVTFALSAGLWPIGGRKILTTGTTATGIIALF
jgi:hypothetical protein